MNTRERLFGRTGRERLAAQNCVLSPQQQIRLHFLCLVREHRLDKLAWHLNGIRRAIRFSANVFASADGESFRGRS